MELPEFNGYQVFGASNMVRFCNHQLHLPSKKNDEGCAQIGLCVSGQGIRQLTRRIKQKIGLIKNNVIISIGTNDVKKLVGTRQFKIALRVLLATLGDRNIVWLTIPPLLAYVKSGAHCRLVQQFNSSIKKLTNKNPNMRVLDLHSIFLNNDGCIREDLYEEYYIQPRARSHFLPRKDGIHFNRRGFALMAEFLKSNLCTAISQ